MECSTSEKGKQLHHENGVKTENLNPPHTYVPWVTFNDVSLRERILIRVKRVINF